jgi:hypothetical protein
LQTRLYLHLPQEVLLHVPWPAPVLEAFASSCSSSSYGRSEQRTSTSSSVHEGSCCSSGSSSGRPRLNIGLAEGQPQCIGPDHLVSTGLTGIDRV